MKRSMDASRTLFFSHVRDALFNVIFSTYTKAFKSRLIVPPAGEAMQ